jgi:acetyltransferase
MRDGTQVVIRPIRPEDEPLIVEFHRGLSERTVRFRFQGTMTLDARTAHERLIRVCFNDYDREMALVAERPAPARSILAVGRLSKNPGRDDAEFSMLVTDQAQGQGLGTELLRRLIAIGRDEKLTRITAQILTANTAMQRICQRLGFALEQDPEEPVMSAALGL